MKHVQMFKHVSPELFSVPCLLLELIEMEGSRQQALPFTMGRRQQTVAAGALITTCPLHPSNLTSCHAVAAVLPRQHRPAAPQHQTLTSLPEFKETGACTALGTDTS